MPRHRQQSAVHPQTGRVDVDEQLVALLEHLWAAGSDTAFSCQGDADEAAQIGFVGWRALCAALELMAQAALAGGDRELFLRMAQCGIDPRDATPVSGTPWKIEAWPDLWWKASAPRPSTWPADEFLFCVLTLPHADLAPLERVLSHTPV
jgi:hypothetical protein